MKKQWMILMVSGLLMVSIGSFAQIRKIPSAVTDALKTQFPAAEKVEWKDKLTVFEASYLIDNKRYFASYNTKGEWQSSEAMLTEADLPEAVKDGLDKSKFKDWEKKSIALVEKKDKTQQYRIYVERATLNKKYLYFNTDGQLAKEAITL